MASTPPVSVWIDDRDPRVKFSGVWPIGGSVGNFHETLSSSTRVGDSFVVPFYGQSIVVFGLIDATSGGVVTNYSIDGAPAVQVTSQRGNGDTAGQQFWASSVLNITKHELKVTMAKLNPDPEPGEGTIWFDYFSVIDPSGHEGVAPREKLSKGGIAGVVVGCVAFLTIVALCVFLWIRRRRLRREQEMHKSRGFVDFGGRDKELWVHGQENRAGWNGYGDPRDVESQSPWSMGSRVRNGIQPFILRSSNIPSQAPPTVRRDEKKSNRVIGAENAGQDRNVRLQNSQSSFGLTTTSATTASPPETREGSSPSPISQSTHKPMPSFGSLSTPSDSGNNPHIVGVAARSLRSQDQAGAREAEVASPVPVSATHEQELPGYDGDPSSSDHAGSESTSESVQPHPSSEDGTSRSLIGIAISDSPITARRTEVSDDENVRLGDGDMVQHVDSGVRLDGEELRLPVELPPVYSSN